ncbi:MAG: hypothetical protein MI740_10120, partial [Halanaerobiales bacterium]|nr:hypothetical protein [Halanaerobiales bacterium]
MAIKKSLVDVVFASEKRKNMLLLLHDGPKEMDFILESLEVRRQALLPQIKILEDYHLLSRVHDTYKLTVIGRLVVDKIKPLQDIINVFDNDINYWGTRKLDQIPNELLKTISKLGKCDVVSPCLSDIYSVPDIYSVTKETSETIGKSTREPIVSNYYGAIATFLYPNTDEIVAKLLACNIDVNLIISEDLLDKIRTDFYSSFAELLENPL